MEIDLIGKQLGEFTILEVIGKGGMATVFRARQPSMDRDVAIKVILPEADRAHEFVRRFDLEARTVANLRHAHISKVINYGYQEPYYYLAMELLLGGTLADRIQQGPLAINETMRILRQICPALDYAHSKGVIHRDLKPQNIMFDETGNTFLSDFGIIRLMGRPSELTEKNAVVGTPAYISPEQWQSDVEIDQRADIYALGVVLYQMLTGKLPFEPDTLYRMMEKHLNHTPIPVRNLRPGLPDGVYAAVDRAMAKKRDQRFRMAGELLAALESALVPRETPLGPIPKVTDGTVHRPAPQTKTAPIETPRVDTPALSAPLDRDDRTEPVTLDPALLGEAPPPRLDVTEPIMLDTPPSAPQLPTRPSSQPPQPLIKMVQPAAKPAPSPPIPLLVGGGVVILLLIAVLVLLSGRGGVSEADQTATQAALLALSATATTPPTTDPTEPPPTATAGSPTVEVIVVGPTSVPATATPLPATADGGPVVVIAPSNTPTPTLTPSLTSTPTPTATFTPSLTPTVTATPTATFTPTDLPTATPLPPTETPIPTIDTAATVAAATAIALNAIEQAAQQAAAGAAEIFRLAGATLTHNTDGTLSARRANVNVLNFVAEATFYNPYPVTQGTWDYGFQFRRGADGTEYRLIVQATGRWGLILRQNNQSTVVLRGDVPLLSTTDTGSNTLRVVVRGAEGWFFVNGVLVSTLDLSARQAAGDVLATTGFLQGAAISGKATRFENFSVAEIR